MTFFLHLRMTRIVVYLLDFTKSAKISPVFSLRLLSATEFVQLCCEKIFWTNSYLQLPVASSLLASIVS